MWWKYNENAAKTIQIRFDLRWFSYLKKKNHHQSQTKGWVMEIHCSSLKLELDWLHSLQQQTLTLYYFYASLNSYCEFAQYLTRFFGSAGWNCVITSLHSYYILSDSCIPTYNIFKCAVRSLGYTQICHREIFHSRQVKLAFVSLDSQPVCDQGGFKLVRQRLSWHVSDCHV